MEQNSFLPDYSPHPSLNFIGNISSHLNPLTKSKLLRQLDENQTTLLSFVDHHTLDV